jgi:hypothetical protein
MRHAPAATAALAARLGPDLWALARRLGVPVRDARPLTTLPSPVLRHASFRLRLVDGRTFKARRVETAAQASQIVTLVSRLERRHFPRVLARRGPALLEEWQAGRPLAAAAAGTPVYRRSGRILGRVHAAPPPALARVATATERLATAEEQVGRLATLGALSPATARRARRRLRDHEPDRVTVGVVHRDFCAENLVVTPAGELTVVDNETVTVDAVELDLARTWYRWPMTSVQWAAFLAGYGETAGRTACLRHFPFWVVAALVDAALFRLVAWTGAASVPLERLEAYLAGPDRRAWSGARTARPRARPATAPREGDAEPPRRAAPPGPATLSEPAAGQRRGARPRRHAPADSRRRPTAGPRGAAGGRAGPRRRAVSLRE